MSETSPVFSVVIPHLNQPEGLERCLASLVSQSLSRDTFEIIVVDNGSNCAVESVVARYQGVRLLQEPTPGPGPARNRGAKAATGAIFAFIDADCRAHPDWLRIGNETLQQAPAGTILGGEVRIVSDGGAENSGIEAYERIFGFRSKLYVEKHGYSGTGNLVVRRHDFERVGPFVGIALAEDIEWGERARRHGFTFRYVPGLIVYHPARNSIQELHVKWDRHIGHEIAAKRQRSGWYLRWVVRASAILVSPFIDVFKPLTSRQIQGISLRVGAVAVLFNIRLYRGTRMLKLLFNDKEIIWNRDRAPASIRANNAPSPRAFPVNSRTEGIQNSPLINYALRGLEACWLPSARRWSHIYHLDGRDPPNESLPQSDVFYSLNVLLGLSRVPIVPETIDIKSILELNASNLTRLPVQKYAFGMALWASAALGIPLSEPVAESIRLVLFDRKGWLRFTAQDLGMILAGVASQARYEPALWSALADELFRYLMERYHCPSGLFFNNVLHLRRRYTSFATHTYLTLACYLYGEIFGRQDAIKLANACAQKLIQLQGPNGEWPWFFDTKRGVVVDFYEVYSVHQYGMAPAFLEFAERHGVSGARKALCRSFSWVMGNNQLNRIMLVPERSLTIRSQYRKGELDTKAVRMVRSMSSLISAQKATLADSSDIQLRLECRSYELGWILWSFGHRTDAREFTHHPLFENPRQPNRDSSKVTEVL